MRRVEKKERERVSGKVEYLETEMWHKNVILKRGGMWCDMKGEERVDSRLGCF